jgi:hypothetical protein
MALSGLSTRVVWLLTLAEMFENLCRAEVLLEFCPRLAVM